MMVACWFAIVKAGAVVVCTMPLLRVRELSYIADKSAITLALCDTRFAAECETAMKKTSGGLRALVAGPFTSRPTIPARSRP